MPLELPDALESSSLRCTGIQDALLSTSTTGTVFFVHIQRNNLKGLFYLLFRIPKHKSA